jgi:hypothetical protein
MNNRLSIILALIVLIVAGAALWYVLTRPASGGGPGMEPSGAADLATTTSKTTEDHGKYYDVTAASPSATPLRATAGAEADAKAVAVMDAWVKDTIDTFKNESGAVNPSATDVQMLGLDQGRKYSLAIKFAEHEDAHTVSYVFDIFEDTLGAHPNAMVKTFTFDKTNGASLSIDDLFLPGTKYLQFLSDTSRAKLRTQIATMSQIAESEVDTNMLNAGTGPNSDSFADFYLEHSSLVLIFPPYSVGPWVIGTQTISIPLSNLESYLQFQYGDQTKG